MRWILNALIFLMFLACSTFTHAQTQMPVECAVEGDRILPADGSICQEDIAFGILYEVFPSIFEELKGPLGLDHFVFDDPSVMTSKRLGEFNGNAVFYVFFGLFHKLVVALVVLYAITLLLSILFKKIQGEDLTDDHGLHRDNWKSWIGGGSVGAAFLLPIKNNLFLGSVFVFVLGTVSLSIANFVASTFWSSQQDVFKQTLELDTSEKPSDNARQFQRHDYLADGFYRYLTRMNICRQESASVMITRSLGSIQSAQQAKTAMQCAYGHSNQVGYSGASQPSAFITVNAAERPTIMGDNAQSYSELQEVLFGSSFRGDQACALLAKEVPDSECGRVEVHAPDWAGNPLLGLIDDPHYIDDQLNVLASAISPQASASEIERVVFSGWQVIYQRIRDELTSSVTHSASKDSSGRAVAIAARERDAQIAALEDANADVIRQLARFYHQSAFNILLFGRHVESRDTTEWLSDDKPALRYSKLNALSYHMEKAAQLADPLIRLQCLSTIQNLASAKKLEDFLAGKIEFLPADVHAKCVDMKTGLVLEFSEFSQQPAGTLETYVKSRTQALQEQFYAQWKISVNELSVKRKAIERSFSRVVDAQQKMDWWVRMRKQGYLAVADYARNINAYVTGYKRDVRLMVNSYTFGPPVYDARYVALGLDPEMKLPAVFADAVEADTVLNGNQLKGKAIDPLVNRYHWLSGQEQISRQPKLQEGEPLDLTQVLNAIENPMTHMNRLGIDIHGGKSLEACPEDASKCPFPLTDPLVELSLMGHDMIDTGISFYSIAIGMKTGVYLLRNLGNAAKKGSISQRSKVDGAVVKASVAKQIGARVMSAVPGIFDVIFQILGAVMALYIAIGAVLAYILPLLQFLYLYMGFISWLMVLTMSSFSVLLWSFFWLRFREKKHVIRQAGLQYGIELLFKPTFNLLSVLFAVFFFYVSTFVVGVSIGWLMQMPLSGEGGAGLRAFIDPLFIILIISAVYFTILKYAYNQMDEFTSALFAKLGIRQGHSRDGLSDTMKAVLFDTVQRKIKQTHDRMSQDKELQGLNARKQRAAQTINAMQEAKSGVVT